MGRFVGVLAALTACVSSETIECGDGVVCPRGRTCAAVVDNGLSRALCVEPDQLTACEGLAENVSCTFGETGIGTCEGNVCIPALCGDGIVSGSEECEATNQALETCDQLEGEFYRPETLGCTACVYDRLGCRMANAGYCGDGRRDFADDEYCDGTDFPFTNDSCLTYGYDAGELGCNTALCTPGFDACATVRWSSEAPNIDAQDMWGSGPDDIYGVGRNGLLVHFDGDIWSNVQTGLSISGDLYGVHGTSANDVYVVGEAGTMLHFDGTAWTQVTLPVTQRLNAVWVSGTTGLAVGAGGTVLRLAGGAWTQVTSPTTAELRSVWGSSPTAIWVGGTYDGSQTGLYKYDGATFTPQTTPGVALWNVLAIDGLPSGEVFVAGYDAGGFGVAARLAGSSWDAIELPECSWYIFDLWVASPTDVYATGSNNDGRSHVLYHFDGTSWTPIVSPSATSTTSVWGTGSDRVYVSAPGGIWRGTGRIAALVPFEWSQNMCTALTTTCASGALSVIAGSSVDNVYAFGPGTSCRYDGLNWTGHGVSPMDYRAAWVSPQGQAFAVGSQGNAPDACGGNRTTTDGVILWGQTTSFSLNPYSMAPHSELLGVHGTSTSNVYAVGTKGPNACTLSPLVLHYADSQWTEVSTTQLTNMDIIRRVWAKSATEVYVMGTGGAFARYNGSTWTALAAVPTFCPAVMDMKGVGNNIYVTCLSDKSLYRYVTTTDTWENAGSAHFATFGARMRLVPLSDTDIFVFGGDLAGNGTISHYKSDKATPVRFDGEPINDAWGTSDRIFWVNQDGVHSLVRTVPW